MRVAVIVYPGSNADWDALHALRDVLGVDARYVFHKERELGAVDGVVLPGGFSYGDYLRSGSIARFSPISQAVVDFADAGGPVLGICNGFQILTELGLLPGALTKNAQLQFECRDVWVRVESSGVFTRNLSAGQVLRLPVAHAEGRYVCDAQTLAGLEAESQVALRYCSPEGVTDPPPPTNGSVAGIAGVYNRARNVLGLMPHPERAAEGILGNDDGLALLRAFSAEPAPKRAPSPQEQA